MCQASAWLLELPRATGCGLGALLPWVAILWLFVNTILWKCVQGFWIYLLELLTLYKDELINFWLRSNTRWPTDLNICIQNLLTSCEHNTVEMCAGILIQFVGAINCIFFVEVELINFWLRSDSRWPTYALTYASIILLPSNMGVRRHLYWRCRRQVVSSYSCSFQQKYSSWW